MVKREVFTRVDEKLYNEVKKKGYKFSELIELGFKCKEKEEEIISKEGINSILEELRKINEEFKSTLKIVKLLRMKIDEIEDLIRRSKTKISSKFFPSKYDMISVLNEIEKKVQELKEYL